MYNEIEKIYKKKSPYNLIEKIVLLIYFVVCLILFVFKINVVIWFAIFYLVSFVVLLFLTSFVIKIIGKIKGSNMSLFINIRSKEKKVLKKHLKDNDLYNEKSLVCIIDHYRSMIKTKNVESEFLTLLSILLPIISGFYLNGNYDTVGFINFLPYLIISIIIIAIICVFFKGFFAIGRILKGEDGMYERLEEIFSELYIECINNKDNIKKDSKESIIKKILKRLKVIK